MVAFIAVIVAVATPEMNLHLHFCEHQGADSRTIHSLRFVASFDFSTVAVSSQLPITFLMCLALSVDLGKVVINFPVYSDTLSFEFWAKAIE